MHWCYQESEALVASVPFVGYYLRKAYVWYHSVFHGKTHNHGECVVNHTHIEVDDNILPIEEWDPISIDEVQERFGVEVIEDLLGNPQLLKIMYAPPENEFAWFVNQQWMLKAEFRGRTFLFFGEIETDATWHELGAHE